VSPFGQVFIDRSRSTAESLDRAEVLHRRVRALQVDSAEIRRDRLIAELGERQNLVAAQSGPELLRIISDVGFAWRDIARLAGVTVPAIQKWRRGDGMTGNSRHALAKIVALLDVLDSRLITHPVSWLEMPVKDTVKVSRLDLLKANRYDLVLELASDSTTGASIDAVLDEYDADWRETRTDESFEAFRASDGVMSIRTKR
jgi:transcriptional regulator with XRE-family HTH domain